VGELAGLRQLLVKANALYHRGGRSLGGPRAL